MFWFGLCLGLFIGANIGFLALAMLQNQRR